MEKMALRFWTINKRGFSTTDKSLRFCGWNAFDGDRVVLGLTKKWPTFDEDMRENDFYAFVHSDLDLSIIEYTTIH